VGSKTEHVNTENADLIEISKRISDHHEKTGTVLVGMHMDLQEQKARLCQHEVQVSALVSALGSQIETIVTTASSRMNEAILGLEALRPIIGEARDSIDHLNRAAAQWSNDIERLRGLHAEAQSEFLSRAEDVLSKAIEPTVERIRAEADRTAEGLAQAVNQASDELRTALNGEFSALTRQLQEQSKLHLEHGAKARDQVSRSMEAAQQGMAQLMLVHREAVVEEFKEIKALASALNKATEAHSRQVSDFARRARYIFLSSAGLVIGAVLLMLYMRLA
jgi:hypothetical protein